MSKFRITALDDDGTVIGRNTFTGADGAATTLAKGESADIEVDSQNQAIISLRFVKDQTSSAQPFSATKVEADGETAPVEPAAPAAPAPALVDATDEEATDVLLSLAVGENPKWNGKGYLEGGAVNDAMRAKGFNNLSAADRERLSDAGGFKKPA